MRQEHESRVCVPQCVRYSGDLGGVPRPKDLGCLGEPPRRRSVRIGQRDVRVLGEDAGDCTQARPGTRARRCADAHASIRARTHRFRCRRGASWPPTSASGPRNCTSHRPSAEHTCDAVGDAVGDAERRTRSTLVLFGPYDDGFVSAMNRHVSVRIAADCGYSHPLEQLPAPVIRTTYCGYSYPLPRLSVPLTAIFRTPYCGYSHPLLELFVPRTAAIRTPYGGYPYPLLRLFVPRCCGS